MANICDYSLRARGEKKNLKLLRNWLNNHSYEYSGDSLGEDTLEIYGGFKWSLESALGYDTLIEYCRKRDIEFEIITSECGCCFSEHVWLIDGESGIDVSDDYHEIYFEDFYGKSYHDIIEIYKIDIREHEDKWDGEYFRINDFKFEYL